mmetsp:Transcript_16/g.45  ORF Transcript_16/g.45 Transcript_16/m.45 type:complete len:206 (-) Transcript_16:387-1004(-)
MRRTASFAQFARETSCSSGLTTPRSSLSPKPSRSDASSLRRAVSFTTLADMQRSAPPALAATPTEHLVITLVSSRKHGDEPPLAPRLGPTGCIADDLAELEPLALEPMLLGPTFMLAPTPQLRPLNELGVDIEPLALPAAMLASHSIESKRMCHGHSPLAARRPAPARAASLLHHRTICAQPRGTGPLLEQLRLDADAASRAVAV